MLNTEVANEIKQAIFQAVSDAGQDEALATKIFAWFTALSNSNDSLTNHVSVHNHMELLMKQVKLKLNDQGEVIINGN